MYKLNCPVRLAGACAAMVVFSFLSSGCSKSSPTGPSSSGSQIVPLSSGNSWTYRSIMYSPTDSVLGDGPVSVVVDRDTTIAGVHLYSFWGWASAGDSGLTTYTDGYFELYFKYPANSGTHYSAWGFSVVVSNLDTVINVPAGSFHCVDYRFYDKGYLNGEYFVSPGAGVIKLVSYFGSNYPSASSVVQNVQTLTSYTVN